ncbi:MAG: hypothetical protein BJ554DRAFT_6054 [Olpidium bornovanus]|uniref:Uncharacterized protein n=1 Tax=Olpidium bornovanus TaxID=278681 RepID=A0A8H7ZYL8_9FUNG|nr:MAG: hypothetical protein BJ554DRAFT_6054 [Olpidium bornovanus]
MNRKEQYYELREHFMQVASKRDDALAKLRAESHRVKRLKEENNHLLDLILLLNPPLSVGGDLESDLTDVETDVEDEADKRDVSAPPQQLLPQPARPHPSAAAFGEGGGGGGGAVVHRAEPAAAVVEVPGGPLAAGPHGYPPHYSTRPQSPPRRLLERT